MTVERAAQWLDALPGKLYRNMARAQRESARHVKEVAVRESSYRRSPAVMRRHPFARRRRRPLLEPSKIGIKTGRFVGSWEVRGPFAFSNSLRSVVFNSDPKSDLLARGTRLMFPRPLPARVVRLAEPRVREIHAKELRDTFRA